ncbi:MAG: ATP-binding protein [Alphaproteobacteria bacterium]
MTNDLFLRGKTLCHVIVQTIAEPVIAFDMGGCLRFLNPAAERLFGVRAEEVVGQRVEVLLHDDYRSKFPFLLAALSIAAPQPSEHEILAQRPDGKNFPALVTLTQAHDDEGHPLFIASVHDITRPKAAEAELYRSREAAEAADIAKSEFLARMSHSLRTPLNAIIGFSEMLFEEVFGPLGSDKYREYARDIKDSGRHLLALINDLLDMARIEVGRYDLNRRMIEVPAVVDWARRHAQCAVEEAGVTLTVDVSVGMPHVYADERALRQVLQNLLSNAIRYSSPGGRIEISAHADASTLTLGVSDDGIGIAPDDLERILRPFERGRNIMLTRDGSVGLGLPLAKHLMEMHGGTLWIESRPGAGTRVWVRMPRLAAPAHGTALESTVKKP